LFLFVSLLVAAERLLDRARGRGRPAGVCERACERSAPGRFVAAVWMARRRRSGLRRLWWSRTPASLTSTRRATSNWSRVNGTTHTGTPAESVQAASGFERPPSILGVW